MGNMIRVGAALVSTQWDNDGAGAPLPVRNVPARKRSTFAATLNSLFAVIAQEVYGDTECITQMRVYITGEHGSHIHVPFASSFVRLESVRLSGEHRLYGRA